MGRPADGRSVVDATGQVDGFESLHVADASIMPTIPGANTNLPVLASRRANRRADRWLTFSVRGGPGINQL